ncbi:ABCB family ABC transporter ATP-binding protein/permease [Derxia gummosa]|uniref:ABCB family ABC transporter ATP-binding protein/permease n=1 Tax=Derxia gummosa DSM 723 TaxID=1121388 RepID=A0A8B6XC75_9BURK|nr:ABC transporter ATP-binding protein/permease [Derxia gummosa]
MRRPTAGPAPQIVRQKSDWQVLRTLLPYLFEHKARVALALLMLAAAKGANVGVPLVMKAIVDRLAPGAVAQQSAATVAIVVPAALLVGYGLLRLATTLFTELREFVFARVTQGAVRKAAIEVFRHLHALSLRFHLERQTGGVTRDIERGTRGIQSLVSYTLYSILPTLIEFGLIIGILVARYDPWFAGITVVALVLYIGWTISVTEWRTGLRRTMNELDSSASTKAIDSLLNYETVKYFGNEDWEARRYDESMAAWQRAAIRSQTSLSLLNTGQSAIIAMAVTAIMWRATLGVVDGRMTLGDLVLVNAFMIQLYVPLNFLGVIYREIKQSIADMDRLFGLLEQHREVADRPGAQTLAIRSRAPEVRFEQVDFGYDKTADGAHKRQILFGVGFTIAPGAKLAVVGHSGSGKSTLARLLFRFYDVDGGRITIDGQDIRDVTQQSLRAAIGIVPQDTVLFNDSIEYNIAYGRPGASHDEIVAAARAAHIHDFIAGLPDGYATVVGERGLKLSGGEKQRVAIARTILKNPAILVFDEATSALDTRSEQAIQRELKAIASDRTTLVIAHRLSTVVDADEILVLDKGRVVERGGHAALLALGGLYAQMWALQGAERAVAA